VTHTLHLLEVDPVAPRTLDGLAVSAAPVAPGQEVPAHRPGDFPKVRTAAEKRSEKGAQSVAVWWLFQMVGLPSA